MLWVVTRSLRNASGKPEVNEVFLRKLKYVLGKTNVTEVCSRKLRLTKVWSRWV
jgi:hypothetical protein